MRVPDQICPETALGGNTHLVVAPGGERQETEGGERGERGY